MARELERRFIVINDQWKQHIKPPAILIEQGYMVMQKGVVRVRIKRESGSQEETAEICFKSKRKIGDDVSVVDRQEWEYVVPVKDAQEIMDTLCNFKIAKTRNYVKKNGAIWTVDEFKDPKYHGLKLAEIELEDPTQQIELPAFVSKASEVTPDERFSTRWLANPDHAMGWLKDYIGERKLLTSLAAARR